MNRRLFTKNKKFVEKATAVSSWSSIANGVGDFIKEAFIKTPFETVFEILLLLAGATRTLDLFNSMGNSAWASVIGLVYAELGIILYEFLTYRGVRIMETKTSRDGTKTKAYPLINQKSLAKLGLWLVHIPLTVFFTMADMILTNMEAAGISSITENFAWILGVVIGASFFADLVIIINYKSSDPVKKHEERMLQVEYDLAQFDLQKQELEAQATLDYQRENAAPLAELKSRLDARRRILEEYKDVVGDAEIEDLLAQVTIGEKVVRDNKKNTGEKNP